MSRTRRLGLFLAFNVIVLGAVALVAAPRGWKDTAWRQTWYLLQVKGQEDSWRPMGRALDYLATSHTTSVYTEMLEHQGVKFQYPPTSLVPYALLRHAIAQTPLSQKRGFAVIGIAALFCIAIATSIILARGLGQSADAKRCLALAIVATITFYPIVWGFTLGQIQIWIDALFAFALLSWLDGRRALAGVLAGLMCLIKPQYGLFLLWAGARREWVYASTLLLTSAVGLVISVEAFGFGQHVGYVNALSFLSQHGEGYYSNQSVNGLLNRIMGLWEPEAYNNLDWRGNSFPPYAPLVYFGTLLTSLTILGTAIFAKERDRVLGFCIMALSITMASPIAWVHHYGLFLPIYAIVFTRFMNNRSALGWLAVSYVLTSNFWGITNVFAKTPLNFIQSYVFFGALILLVLLYRASKATAPPLREFESLTIAPASHLS